MLPGAGFGDDAPGAHLAGQQGLAKRIVDLVRARMRKVFALQVNLGAPAPAEFRRGRKGRRATDPVSEFPVQVRHEVVIVEITVHLLCEPAERGHQRFRRIAATERPVTTVVVGQLVCTKPCEQRRSLGFIDINLHEHPLLYAPPLQRQLSSRGL